MATEVSSNEVLNNALLRGQFNQKQYDCVILGTCWGTIGYNLAIGKKGIEAGHLQGNPIKIDAQ